MDQNDLLALQTHPSSAETQLTSYSSIERQNDSQPSHNNETDQPFDPLEDDENEALMDPNHVNIEKKFYFLLV